MYFKEKTFVLFYQNNTVQFQLMFYFVKRKLPLNRISFKLNSFKFILEDFTELIINITHVTFRCILCNSFIYKQKQRKFYKNSMCKYSIWNKCKQDLYNGDFQQYIIVLYLLWKENRECTSFSFFFTSYNFNKDFFFQIRIFKSPIVFNIKFYFKVYFIFRKKISTVYLNNCYVLL